MRDVIAAQPIAPTFVVIEVPLPVIPPVAVQVNYDYLLTNNCYDLLPTLSFTSDIRNEGEQYGVMPSLIGNQGTYFTINGWKNGNGHAVTSDTIVSDTNTHTLTADIAFTPPTTTVSFNGNGLTLRFSSTTIKYGEPYVFPTPVRTDVVIDSWKTSDGTQLHAGATSTSFTNHTLTATWHATSTNSGINNGGGNGNGGNNTGGGGGGGAPSLPWLCAALALAAMRGARRK